MELSVALACGSPPPARVLYELQERALTATSLTNMKKIDQLCVSMLTEC